MNVHCSARSTDPCAAIYITRHGVPLPRPQKNADLPLEAGTRYYLPPCSRNTPPPPVPTLECGTLYRVSLVGSPNSSAGVVSRNLFAESGAHGRRLQRQHFHAHRHHHSRQGHHHHGQHHRSPHQHPNPLLQDAASNSVMDQQLPLGVSRRSLAITGECSQCAKAL